VRRSVLVPSLYLTLPLALLCTSASDIRAGSKTKGPRLPAASIHQMVRNVAWNEFQASEHPTHYYRYLERNISADGSTTSVEVETPHGDVDRLIEVNNHPPDAQQLKKNQQLLEKLPGDTKLQRERLKDQQSDKQRRDNVIKDIPDAFIYSYAGRDPKGMIMLKFRPAPDFQPSSRQSLILQGMAGELWVDPATQRMVKIDGKLIQDVKIGWGFLARLQKGGTFLMQQSKGPDGTWHQKLLSVHFDGTVFIFKHIHIRVNQIRCCFERVPDNLSIRAAVHLLQGNMELPADWQSRLEPAPKSSGLHPHSSDHALRR
jgi:hypothetical protein